MSNARNLADLIASGGVIEASEIADSTITGGKLASDITISTTGSITSGDLTVDTDTLYVDSTNNRVGIGTTSPSTKLEIYESDVNNYPPLTVGIGQNDGEAIGIYKATVHRGGIRGIGYLDGIMVSGDQFISLGIDNQSKLSIISSGNVGIGTMSPGYNLEVTGDARITTDLTVNGSQSITPAYTFVSSTGSIALSSTQSKIGSTSLFVESGEVGTWQQAFLPQFDSGDAWCLEFWFYVPSITTNTRIVSNVGDGNPRPFFINLLYNSGSPKIEVNMQQDDGAIRFNRTPDNSVSSATWHHLAISNDGSTLRVYLDGVQQFSYGLAGVIAPDIVSYLEIGQTGSPNDFYIDGFRISDVNVYPSGITFTPPTSLTVNSNTVVLSTFEGSDGDTSFTTESKDDVEVTTGMFVDGSAGNIGINTLLPNSELDVRGTVTATTFSGSGASLTSIPNSALNNSSITIAGDSGSDGVSLGETLTISGTANEIETTGTSNTLTIGLPDDVTIGNDLTVTEKLKINTTTQLGRLTISGSNDYDDGPVLWLHGDSFNQLNSGTIRLTENNASMQGAWISYNGAGNRLLLGTNAGSTFDTSNDVTHISMLRGSGFVGINIGDANPAHPLVVGNNLGTLDAAIEIKGLFPYLRYTDTGDSTYAIQQLNASTFTHTQSGNIQYRIIQDTSTRFYYNAIVDGDLTVDTDTLHVDSTNNRVGVGTTSPTVELDVTGSGTFSGDLTVDTDTLYVDSTNNLVGIRTSSPAAGLDIATTGTNGRALQLRSGDTSSSTDSSQIIFTFNGRSYDVNGFGHSIRTRHNSTSTSGNAIDFWLWDQSTDAQDTLGSLRVMTIEGEDGGKVGIGTPFPSYNLHVVGDAYISTDLTVDTDTLHVDSTNNRVGIGTSSPDSRLEVLDSSATGIISRSSSTQATDTNKALRVRNNSDTNTFSVSYKGSVFLGSGTGIYFDGSTSGSNALDDYEEGTFTPSWNSVNGITATYSHQNGNYTKVGNLVHIDIFLRTTALSGGGSAGGDRLHIYGLPFTATGTASFISSFTNIDGVSNAIIGFISGTQLVVNEADGDISANDLFTNDLGTGSDDNQVWISMTYRTTA